MDHLDQENDCRGDDDDDDDDDINGDDNNNNTTNHGTDENPAEPENHHPIRNDDEGAGLETVPRINTIHLEDDREVTTNTPNTAGAVAAAANEEGEVLLPIPTTTTENVHYYDTIRNDNDDDDVDGGILLPNEYGHKQSIGDHHRMSRQSTVSSLAGNSIDFGGGGGGEDTDAFMNDDIDIDDHIDMDNDDVAVGTASSRHALPENVILDRVRCPDDPNRHVEERSLRSDRPDPPPSSDIRMTILPIENHIQPEHHNPHHPEITEIQPDTNGTATATIMDHNHNHRAKHRHVTTAEEDFAVEALASLSINMAEMTLSEDYHPNNTEKEEEADDMHNDISRLQQQQQQQAADPSRTLSSSIYSHPPPHDIINHEWDLNRPALLAETPNGVTLRKTSSLKAMAHPTDNDRFYVADSSNHSITTVPYHRSLSVPKIYNVPTTATTTTDGSIMHYSNPNRSDSRDSVPTETATMSTEHVGADHLIVLPRVDEGNRFFYPPPPPPPPNAHQPQYSSYPSSDIPKPPTTQNNMTNVIANTSHPSSTTPSGRRKIRLRLQEEIRNNNAANISKKRHTRSTSLLGSIRKSSTRMLRFSGVGSGVGGNSMSFLSNWEEEENNDNNFDAIATNNNLYTIVDRGHLMVGWFDGTSTFELQQHIHKSVLRKLQQLFSVIGDRRNKNGNNADDIIDIEDIRILDESFDPPEDVVLSPYIPNGSQFLLRFGTIRAGTTKTNETRMKMDYHDGSMTPMSVYSGRAPDSPSAAPSPHLDKHLLNGLNAKQLALLNSLNIPTEKPMNRRSSAMFKDQIEPPSKLVDLRASTDKHSETEVTDASQSIRPKDTSGTSNDEGNDEHSKRIDSNGGQLLSEMSSDDDDNADDATMMLHSDDPIEARLREITNLLLLDRKKDRYRRFDRQREKRQVVFVVANYFVLFLAIIAISAELQARAPNWIKMMEEHLQNVQNCSENHEALFECVSRGDFAGLIASVVLWLSRSVATKRIFLFGFDTPKKLWTVVYESLVTSVCWGISYLFIRRGMNPDTRPRFVHKYWKDAVYGSLAGFNAAFLKHILKNLIPEQVVEDALRERQLKIMGWLPSFNFR